MAGIERKTNLRLSDEDHVAYAREYNDLAKLRDFFASAGTDGDKVRAKYYRQQISALYNRYACKQLPEEPEPEYISEDESLTLEERVDRIEEILRRERLL